MLCRIRGQGISGTVQPTIFRHNADAASSGDSRCDRGRQGSPHLPGTNRGFKSDVRRILPFRINTRIAIWIGLVACLAALCGIVSWILSLRASQRLSTGHAEQCGREGTQVNAPNSIMAWLNVEACGFGIQADI
jgi:hypothetical protein